MKKNTTTIIAILFCANLFAQNVGIGTINPTGAKLQVESVDSAAFLIHNTTVATNAKTGIFFKADASSYSGSIATVKTASVTYRMGFYTFGGFTPSSLQERMSITDGGNVGIGTTIPTEKLEIAGNVKITGGTPSLGKILTSDATGVATWQVPVVVNNNSGFSVATLNSSSLTLSTAFQTITFADEDFDDAGAFSSTEFTAPTAGVYHFDCSVYDLSFSGVTPSASNYVELQMIPPAGITYIYSKSYLPNLATGYVPALNISQTLKLAAGNKVSFAIKKSFNNGSLILGSFSDSFSGYKVY